MTGRVRNRRLKRIIIMFTAQTVNNRDRVGKASLAITEVPLWL